MQVCNIFGGPGIGKSILAAELFASLKRQRLNVELTTEYVKKLIWAERHKQIKDQLYLFAKQNHKLEMLRDVVDYAVTDSPLLLPIIYQPTGYYSTFAVLAEEIFKSYDNINIVIERNLDIPYQPEGRAHTLDQAIDIDSVIRQLLTALDIEYYVVYADSNALNNIIDIVKAH